MSLENNIKKDQIDDYLLSVAYLYNEDEKQYKNIIKMAFVNFDVIGPLKLQILFNDEWYQTSDNGSYYYYRIKKLYMD